MSTLNFIFHIVHLSIAVADVRCHLLDASARPEMDCASLHRMSAWTLSKCSTVRRQQHKIAQYMFVLGSFLFEYKRSANAWWAAAVFFGHSLFHVLIIWRFSFVCVYFKTYDSCRFVIFWRAFVGARSSNNVVVLKINYNYQYSNKTSNKQVFNYDKLAFVIFQLWKF